MFSCLDPLVDFRCPQCGVSLRFRRVPELPHSPGSPHFLLGCPACGTEITRHLHPAFPNPWLWMRFVAPGITAAALAIFVPGWAWLYPLALWLLPAGLLAVVVYMVRERWGRRIYQVSGSIGAAGEKPAGRRG